MKRFKLHGNTANWVNGLRMSALNLRTLAEETSTPIPTDKRMYVSVANNIFHVEDTRREIIKGEISDTDKSAILASIKADTPDFLLTLEDKVVGYANLCSRHGHRATATATDTESAPYAISIDDIVDGATLALLIVPATLTTPAHKKVEKKNGKYLVTQTITISVTEEITAESKESAMADASDLLSKVEDFLDENYGDSQLTYITYHTSDYNTTAEEEEE